MPEELKRHRSALISDIEVLICGGYDPNGISNKCWIYNHDVGAFTSIASLNIERHSHALGVVQMSNGTRYDILFLVSFFLFY